MADIKLGEIATLTGRVVRTVGIDGCIEVTMLVCPCAEPEKVEKATAPVPEARAAEEPPKRRGRKPKAAEVEEVVEVFASDTVTSGEKEG